VEGVVVKRTFLNYGQARIIEAMIASMMILTTFTVAFQMFLSSENVFRQENVDLNNLAYNTLHYLAESSVIERTIESGHPEGLSVILRELLPRGLYFHLMINKTHPAPSERWLFTNIKELEGPGEIVSVSMTYTSRAGNIYNVILRLMRGGY